MDTRTRLETTKFIWALIAVILVALFISSGIGDGLETGHVILGVVALIVGGASTGFIWNPDHVSNDIVSDTESGEKAKRERIETVLRDLSNEELIALKNRLADGTIDDDLLYERMALSDDGELIAMDKQS